MSSSSWRAKSSARRRKVRPYPILTFPPHLLPPNPPSPSLDIAALFPGPYLSYYDAPTAQLVSQAINLVHRTLQTQGPFDGVVGFSQGAALAATVLLEAATLRPYDDAPFGLAVFFGASAPFDRLGKSPQGRLPAAWEFNARALEKLNGTPLLRRYDAEDKESGRAKIAVPTVHVIGDVDPYRGQAEDLVRLCAGGEDSDGKFVVRHPEGHRVPWLGGKVTEIVGEIRECVEVAGWAS